MSTRQAVKAYIHKHPEWAEELTKLQGLLAETEMEETMKWGIPTYTLNGKNVAGIGAFKSYVGLWFFNGSFLKDEKNLLINAQEGKTRGLRQMRFGSLVEIDEKVIRPYLLEAIENQRQGKEIKPEKKPLVIPEELKEILSQDAGLSEAFDELTPGKQKEYAEYIAEAKREDTKLNRLEKIKPMIRQRIGLNDKYKS